MRRYLPLVVLITGLVVVLPAVLVSAIVPRGSPPSLVLSGLSAMGLSMAIAAAGAAVWKRQPHSRDVVFADLLLWGWVRRCWAERRLSQARALYDSARRAGPSVSIELLTGLSRLLEARDAYTHGHGQRVARHAGQIARAMALSPVEIARIRTAAAVHDVGKLYTPQEILTNPRRLSAEEYEVAKRHAAWGARMLADVGDPEIAAMVRHHHERIDGHGYPDGLGGSDIPLGARIIAVADTFDAITSSRAYRKACTHKRALDVLAAEAGTQLDPVAVTAFANCYSARRSVAWLALAATVPGRALAGLQATSQSFGAAAGGIASILPGVGVAGMLALSPGLHHNTLAVHDAHRPPGLSESHRLAHPTAASAVRGRTGPTANSRPTPSAQRRRQPTVRTTQPTARSRHTTPGASTPANGVSTRSHEPVSAGPSPEPTRSPAPTVPVSPPPVAVLPTVPAPPTPPVSIPTVPGVNPPPVQVPPVPGPGVVPPTVGTPRVTP